MKIFIFFSDEVKPVRSTRIMSDRMSFFIKCEWPPDPPETISGQALKGTAPKSPEGDLGE
jgi:hypothetical protein